MTAGLPHTMYAGCSSAPILLQPHQQSHTGGGGEQGLSVCMRLGGEEEAPGAHSAAAVGKERLSDSLH